jgi:hypothetical protein
MTAVSSISRVVGQALEANKLTVPSISIEGESSSAKSKSPMLGAFPRALPPIVAPYGLDAPLDLTG